MSDPRAVVGARPDGPDRSVAPSPSPNGEAFRPNAPQPELSFVILTWNSERFIGKCLESVRRKCDEDGLGFEVFVVDNGSRDGTKAASRGVDLGPAGRLELIELNENRGTTYPRNLGLKRAKGRYLCVLDSDTELREGSLRSVCARLAADPEIGIVAPQLRLRDDTIQHSVKRLPKVADKLKKVPAILLRRAVPKPDFYTDFPFGERRFVESAISACWFFRRELLDLVGYLDERIFYAPEDVEFCLRVLKAGKRILYDPSVGVFHDTQQISHRKPFSKIALSHAKGLAYYYTKHGAWFGYPKAVLDAGRGR